MPPLLVRTPSPKHGESLLGYVLRISEKNGYKSIWQVFSLAGITQGSMLSSGLDTDPLAAILGVAPETLRHLAYSYQDNPKRVTQLNGHPLHFKALRLTRPRLCPHCTAEDGYISAEHDLALYVACARHGTWLLDGCPACGRPVSWFRGGLLECSCGADWKTAIQPTAHPPLVDLMQAISAVVHGTQPKASIAGLPVASLSTLNLRSLVQLIGVLGDDWESKQPTVREPIDIAQYAANALASWPHGFFNFLRAMGRGPRRRGGTLALRKQFEALYGRLFKYRAAERGPSDFLRKAFLEFGLTEWGEAVVDRRMLCGDEETLGRILATQADMARSLHVTPSTIRKLTSAGVLPGRVIGDGQERTVYAHKELSFKGGGAGRSFGIRAAAAYLGLPVSVLQGLRASGHYRAEHMARVLAAWHEADLDTLRQKIRTRAVPSPATIQAVSLGDAMRMKFKSPEGKADLLRQVIDGAMPVYGNADDPLTGLRLERSELQRFANDRRAASRGASRTPTEAAKRLHCDPLVIPSLVERGLLDGIHVPAGLRVTEESLGRFGEQYVSVAHLAKEQRTSSKRLIRLFREQRVQLLMVRRKGTGKEQPFLRRA